MECDLAIHVEAVVPSHEQLAGGRRFLRADLYRLLMDEFMQVVWGAMLWVAVVGVAGAVVGISLRSLRNYRHR